MTKIRPSPARSEPVSGLDSVREPERQRAHECGGGQGDQPGDRHPAGDRPAHLGTRLADAAAQDRTGRHVGGRQGHARGAGAQDDRGRRRLGGQALRRLDLDETLAESADDTPATDVGAEADRERAAEDDPERQAVLLHVAGQVAGGDEGERDDTHRLLRVVGAVRQRDERRGGDLAPAEALLAALRHHVAGDPVDQPGAARRDEAGDHRARRRQG